MIQLNIRSNQHIKSMINRPKAKSKTDHQIKAVCNLDAILNESLMHLISSKFDENITYKLDQKRDQKPIKRS